MLAVQRHCGALRVGGRLHHALGPGHFVGRRAEGVVDHAPPGADGCHTWRRSRARARAGFGAQAGVVVEGGVHAVDRRLRCRPAATPARAASGSTAARRLRRRCRGRAGNRCEPNTSRCTPGRAPARARWQSPARRFDQRQHAAGRRGAAPLRRHVLRRSALGSITPATPGRPHSARSSRNHVGVGAVDAHQHRLRGRSQPRPALRARQSSRPGATASSRSTITASAPLRQRLVEALGPVGRHEQVGAGHAQRR